MQMNFATIKKPRVIVASIVVFALLTIWIVIYLIGDSKKTANIDILIAPRSASLTIGGNRFSTDGIKKIVPGEYDVVVQKRGFETYEDKIIAIEGETIKLSVALIQADGSTSWYDNHPEDNMLFTAVSDRNAEIAMSEFRERHPITTILPISFANYYNNFSEYVEFRIDFGMEGESLVLIVNDTTGGNRERALDLIRNRGFDPEEYEIVYNYVPR